MLIWRKQEKNYERVRAGKLITIEETSSTVVFHDNNNRGEEKFERCQLGVGEDRVLCLLCRVCARCCVSGNAPRSLRRVRNFDINSRSRHERWSRSIDRQTSVYLHFIHIFILSGECGRRRAVISETLFRVLARCQLFPRFLARKFLLIRSRTFVVFFFLFSPFLVFFLSFFFFNSLCTPCIPVSGKRRAEIRRRLLFSREMGFSNAFSRAYSSQIRIFRKPRVPRR